MVRICNLMCGVDMAPGDSRASAVEFHASHHRVAPRPSDCDVVQPVASCAGNGLPTGQFRCSCEAQLTSCLKGDLSPKDASKRKRVNRTARLKQCKLDARREQWLSRRGSHECRSRHDKQDCPKQITPPEESPANVKAGKPSSPKEVEFHLHGAVISEFPSEENGVTKKNSHSLFSSPNFVGSVNGHSMVLQTSRGGGNGRSELPAGTSQMGTPQIEICKSKRRPNDPNRSDLEGTHGATGSNQFHWEATDEIRDYDPGYHLLDLDFSQTDNTQRSCKSVIARVGLISSDNTDAMVLAEKNGHHEDQRNGLAQRYASDPLSSPSDSRCTSRSTSRSSAESGSEDNDEESFAHEAEDDWEVAADALNLPAGSSLVKVTGQLPKPAPEGKDLERKGKLRSGSSELQNTMLKPDYKCSKAAGFGMNPRGLGGRAWRPDDMSRPPTLPRLAKHNSFPLESSAASVWNGGHQQGHNGWGPPPVPSYCPICTEELDITDTSFFPCSCGFRLCLFCHHRISSDDGRCPGCRKAYSPDVTKKLSASTTSLWLRT